MEPVQERNREIGQHILTGSITMIGVCITVIALFGVMNTSLKTYADELLHLTILFSLLQPCLPMHP